MSKNIQDAILELNSFRDLYEEDYEKWDAKYWQNGIENISSILKDVDETEYDAVVDDCVADDPSGETYINSVAYVENNKPKIWYWVRENR